MAPGRILIAGARLFLLMESMHLGVEIYGKSITMQNSPKGRKQYSNYWDMGVAAVRSDMLPIMCNVWERIGLMGLWIKI